MMKNFIIIILLGFFLGRCTNPVALIKSESVTEGIIKGIVYVRALQWIGQLIHPIPKALRRRIKIVNDNLNLVEEIAECNNRNE